MMRHKVEKELPKLVWRITADAPQGEYVDPKQAVLKQRQRPESAEERDGWLASSLELAGGVRVSETPMDTLPGELLDQFDKLKR